MRFSLVIAGSTLLTGLLACSPDHTPTAAVTVRDSAGIRIVENHAPAWQEAEPWILEEHPALELGGDEGESGPILYAVTAVRGLSDGRIVVVNAGSHQLFWYNEHGEFLHAVGREGEGPGEFYGMYDLFRCAGDTLAVRELRRVSFLDRNGEFLRVHRILPRVGDGGLRVHNVSPDCTSLLFGSAAHQDPPPAGQVEALPYALFWEPHGGEPRDTVASGFRWIEHFGGIFDGLHVALGRPWSLSSVWAAAGNNVYLGMADQPEIRMLGPTGRLLKIIRWEGEPEPITVADRRLYEERREEFLRGQSPVRQDIYPPLDRSPVPDRKPFYSGLMVDDQANLWVQRYPSEIAGGRIDVWPKYEFPVEWMVFDAGGRWMGEITTPAGHRVLGIERDQLITVWRDHLDVERVRFYRLNKSGQ